MRLQRGEKKQGDEKQAKFLSTQCIGQFEAYSSTQCALYNLKSAKSAIFGVKKKFGLWLKLSKFGVVTLELIINHNFNIFKALFSR